MKKKPSNYVEPPTEEEIADALAVIQRGWSNDTMLLRIHGITNVPAGTREEELLASQLRNRTNCYEVPYIHINRCDYRRFCHHFFTRGGITTDFPLYDEYGHAKYYPAHEDGGVVT